MRLRMDNTVLFSERYGVSNRTTAAIDCIEYCARFGFNIGIRYQPRHGKNKTMRKKSRIYKKKFFQNQLKNVFLYLVFILMEA